MSAAFEGDLIRPLGVVTLYCAHAEGELDDLLTTLAALDPKVPCMLRRSLGQKLEHAHRLAERLDCVGKSDLLQTLQDARRLFDERNELIRGRLFAGGRLVSPGRAVPRRLISVQDLEKFAESIWALKEKFWWHRERTVKPALTRRASGAGS